MQDIDIKHEVTICRDSKAMSLCLLAVIKDFHMDKNMLGALVENIENVRYQHIGCFLKKYTTIILLMANIIHA